MCEDVLRANLKRSTYLWLYGEIVRKPSKVVGSYKQTSHQFICRAAEPSSAGPSWYGYKFVPLGLQGWSFKDITDEVPSCSRPVKGLEWKGALRCEKK